MTDRSQKWLAIATAAAVAAGFVAANAHLLAVAFGSQPACSVAAGAEPARRAC